MDRRQFIASGVAAGVASAAASTGLADHHAPADAKPFKLKYAPHFGMFKHHAGNDFVDQIKFAHDQGFTAWEDNRLPRRSVEDQQRIGKALADLNMTMGVFVSWASFNDPKIVTDTSKAFQDGLRKSMTGYLEVAKRVNAKWTTVVPGGVNNRLDPYYQFANVVENLKVMAEVCEPAGLVMVLEPLNWYRNHAGCWLRGVPQAYAVCKAVGSPSCKILNDLYHQQIDIGNLIPNLDMAWDETPYIQVGDNPGRKEPTTGEINYKSIFKHLHKKGYTGVVGMEHGNSRPGKEGELALIAAYREVDNF